MHVHISDIFLTYNAASLRRMHYKNANGLPSTGAKNGNGNGNDNGPGYRSNI